ncbi:MAG: 5-oxoprolinase subunit PxpA [Clostridiales bacterium]|nr:5-oxoprolinase subunit PxpA [Clostridiales bacterium]
MKMGYSIDLNSDVGEGFGVYKMGGDEEIIKYVTAANVACGFHAGDPMVMAKTVHMAKEHGVVVGAHPGYADRMGFGRRKMVLSFDELKNDIKYQLGALNAFVTAEGMKLHHMCPHGAINQYDEQTCHAICEAVYDVDPSIIIYNIAGALLGKVAQETGLRNAHEIFADRAYMDDMSLVPRSQEGSMITDEDYAIERCIRMVKEGTVVARSGKVLEIQGDTLCVHGDGPKAIAFVKQISDAFRQEGIEIKTLE